MKKILSICALTLSVAALTSCSDFLDQKSESEVNTGTVYNSEYYTSIAINKVYGDLCKDRTYSQDWAMIYNLNSDIEFVDGFGDNATAVNERGYMNYNAAPSGWTKMADMWTAMYGTIEDCNLIINGIENSSIKDNSAMKRYLGEARTIRAMVYFDLLRVFGDIPLKLEPTASDLSNAYLAKTDRDEIMDSLMNDLEKAVEELPWAGQNSYTTEHATKGYAHALLAQIALTRAGYAIRESAKDGYETAAYSDATYPTQRPDATKRKELYELALTHLSAIIKGGYHHLNPSFANEWNKINQLSLDQTYQENIFEIPMLLNVSGELGYTAGYRLAEQTSDFGYTNSSGKIKLPATLFYSYNDGDSRRDLTIATTQIKGISGAGSHSQEQMLGNAPFELYVGKWDPRQENATWLEQNLAASGKHMTGINPVKVRYSQVLLWYAEVMNELAGPDGTYTGDAGMTARQALAEVHNRAFDDNEKANVFLNKISGNKEDFFNAIVEENAWELAGEGARKWDLIRWNLLAEKTKETQKLYLEDLNNEVFQKTIYFNYKDDNKYTIDMNSITWNGIPEGKLASDYAGNTSSFGNSKLNGTDKQVYTNLANISSGLVGVFDPEAGTWTTPKVINRYLMPIPQTIIDASNNTLTNSYGY